MEERRPTIVVVHPAVRAQADPLLTIKNFSCFSTSTYLFLPPQLPCTYINTKVAWPRHPKPIERDATGQRSIGREYGMNGTDKMDIQNFILVNNANTENGELRS